MKEKYITLAKLATTTKSSWLCMHLHQFLLVLLTEISIKVLHLKVFFSPWCNINFFLLQSNFCYFSFVLMITDIFFCFLFLHFSRRACFIRDNKLYVSPKEPLCSVKTLILWELNVSSPPFENDWKKILLWLA